MPSSFRRSLPIAGVAVMMAAAPLLAGPPGGAAPHVRPETVEARELLDTLSARSPSGRRLLDRLNDADVIVYVRHRRFAVSTLEGRISIVRSRPTGTRFLIVELACGRPQIDQLATLGHELLHAVEIADAAGVIDARTLAAHYSKIGFRVEISSLSEAYETSAARDVSNQIRRELFATAARTSHDRH